MTNPTPELTNQQIVINAATVNQLSDRLLSDLKLAMFLRDGSIEVAKPSSTLRYAMVTDRKHFFLTTVPGVFSALVSPGWMHRGNDRFVIDIVEMVPEAFDYWCEVVNE